jgi:hypothetical protein
MIRPSMTRFSSGFWTAFRWRGVPIRLHWSLLVGSLFLSRLEWRPGIWLGYFVVVVWHEMGHAMLVRRMGLRTHEIQVHGLGGVCVYDGTASPYQRAVIAWGGVLAQAIVLFVAWPLDFALGPFTEPFVFDLMRVFVISNAIIIAINLVPIGPLDGKDAWKLFGLWRARRQRESAEPPIRRRDVEAAMRARPQKRVPDAARDKDGEQLVIDEEEVRETVREALERAKRESREGRGEK